MKFIDDRSCIECYQQTPKEKKNVNKTVQHDLVYFNIAFKVTEQVAAECKNVRLCCCRNSKETLFFFADSMFKLPSLAAELNTNVFLQFITNRSFVMFECYVLH